jgi:hypothetical protein
MTAARKIVLALVAAGALSGCQPAYQDASARVGGRAEAYARTWADPGSPRPDLPPDRDSGKN